MTAAQIDAALAADPDFAAICDERDAALPWGPQWCEADALDAAAGVLA